MILSFLVCSNPSVFYFYNYLRSHPLILKQQQVSAATTSSVTTGDNWSSNRTDPEKTKVSLLTLNVCWLSANAREIRHFSNHPSSFSLFQPSNGISAVERRLYFMTAHVHFSNGCPALGLEVRLSIIRMLFRYFYIHT